MLHERLMELERLCHQEKALLAGKCPPRSLSSASGGSNNFAQNFMETHNRMLSWLQTQKRLMPQPIFIKCLSNRTFSASAKDMASDQAVSTQSLHRNFLPSSSSHSKLSLSTNTPSANTKNRDTTAFKFSDDSTKMASCHGSGYRSMPEQSSMSSDDNRSPLTPGHVKRSFAGGDQNLSKSRQHLYPSDSSMPNTPSLSPSIRSPSILKRVDSSPRIAQNNSPEGNTERVSQLSSVPNKSAKPQRSIMKKRTSTFEKEKHDAELLRSSPDGCSRSQPFSVRGLDNRGLDNTEFIRNNRKFSMPCTSCITPEMKIQTFQSQCHSLSFSQDTEAVNARSARLFHGNRTNYSPILQSFEELLSEQNQTDNRSVMKLIKRLKPLKMIYENYVIYLDRENSRALQEASIATLWKSRKVQPVVCQNLSSQDNTEALRDVLKNSLNLILTELGQL